MGFFRKELVWAIVLMLGSINAGQPLAFMSAAGPQFQTEFGWSTTSVTWFSTLVPLLAILGAPVTNLFVPKLGRKKSTFLFGIISIVTWILLAITQKSFSWLAFVARVIHGVANGGLNSLCPMYIVELAPDELKSSYGTFHQLGITIGISFDYLLGIWCKWWLMAILNCLTITVMCIAIWFIPESPAQMASSSNSNANHESLFQTKFIPPFIASLLMVFFQQFAGLNAMSSNLQSIFEGSGVSLNPSVAALLTGLCQTFSTLLDGPLIKKFGRRTSFVISEFGQVIALLLFWASDLWDLGSITPIIALFLDFFFYGLGCGPIPWFIVPELFPDSIRQLAVSTVTTFNLIFISITIIIWPEMSSAMGMGWGMFVFCICCLLGGIYGVTKMPDPSSEKLDVLSDDENDTEMDEVVETNPLNEL